MNSVKSFLTGEEPLIGIIGGLGPYAGIDVYHKLLANTAAHSDQAHLNVIISSLPGRVPDRTAWLENRDLPNPAYGMFESAARLYATGVRLALVACNTAHAGPIFSVFQDLVGRRLPELRILHLVDCCRDWLLSQTAWRKPGLLATRGTYLAGVYTDSFAAGSGSQLLVPSEHTRQAVHRAIYDERIGIKACARPVSRQALALLKDALTELRDMGADSIILGCTELSLAIGPDSVDLPLVYPTVIAVRELIRRVRPSALTAEPVN